MRSSPSMSRFAAVKDTRLRGDEGALGHGEVHTLVRQPSAVLLANERILLRIQDGPPTLVDPEQVASFDLVAALLFDAPARMRSTPVIDHAQRLAADAEVRSEERRVGKECRSR